MANGNPAEDWAVDGAHAVRVISWQDATQILPVGVSRVIIYTTSASMPGQHRSSDTIDIFDSDKPCGNPCEQVKLQMTRRATFYENSCIRSIAVGDGMVASAIASGQYLVRARPVTDIIRQTSIATTVNDWEVVPQTAVRPPPPCHNPVSHDENAIKDSTASHDLN